MTYFEDPEIHTTVLRRHTAGIWRRTAVQKTEPRGISSNTKHRELILCECVAA